NRVYECAEPFRLADTVGGSQGSEHAGERLPPYVCNCLRGAQPGSQFKLDQLSDIGNKVLLGPKVSGTKTLHVGCIKGLKLQELASRTSESGVYLTPK